jgi:molybdopterin-guanine dinucleotide biosynthesis protein A
VRQAVSKHAGGQVLSRHHSHLIETRSRETLPLPVTGVILCGGKSSRMGTAKAFLPYAGSTFVEHRLNMMRELFAEVLIVANDPDAYWSLSVDVVKDILPDRGPLVGILSALLVCQHEHVFAVACDMPLVDNRLMRQMSQSRHDTDVLVLEHQDGIEPLLGLYSKRCIKPMEEAIFAGNLKTMDFLAGVSARTFKFEEPASQMPAYFNVNTPQEYTAILSADTRRPVPPSRF